MTTCQTLRLLMDVPRAGAKNMAMDEAMLLSANSGGEPALRLYAWSQPTVSLGYFQKWADWRGQAGLAALPAVRRITGGGAIVHADELTYSVVLPLEGPWLAALGDDTHVTSLYEGFHAAIAGAAVRLGARAGALTPAGREAEAAAGRGHVDEPFLCFARRSRYDLVAGGRKIVGSAQRCLSRAVLQHGSVVLHANGVENGATGLDAIVGRTISWSELADAILAELADRGIKLQRGELTEAEQVSMDGLLVKHRAKEWRELR